MREKKSKSKRELSVYEKRKQIFNLESGVAHEVFVKIGVDQRITEHTEKGVRVLVAKYPDIYKIYFFKYIPIGSTGYPRGGIKVFNATTNQFQCFYFESVAIHPRGGKYSFECEMEES